jgi:AmiR/NasT family two-component response regulator
LARRLNQLRQPFMFLTESADESLIGQAVDAGAITYLVKPVDPVQIVPTVRVAIQRANELAVMTQRTERLTAARDGNRDINVVIGLLMAHRGLTRDLAFQSLRKHARGTRQKLEDIAAAILSGVEVLHGLPTVASGEYTTTRAGNDLGGLELSGTGKSRSYSSGAN